MQVILTGHDKTAIAMKSAVEMIFGQVDNFQEVPFLQGEGLETVQAKMKAVIKQFDTNEEILVIADLFSGTPYNAASTLCLKGLVTDVIAGMSLPICLEVANMSLSMTCSQLTREINQNSTSYTRILSLELQKTEEDDME
ncbi:PTS sugar transporter subunit IIA [Bombilactobacillus folatiphilus]|uniref:PTS sugar transporter subunit IIA n=1 Tax=Bombilactobacillus folatiphilus TaxID=2923362 RepID=A0ABY4P6V4_9LACO|nr:PTS sugar transporter subunit IIA [Bombilactobacillus folatiphilus]UQS81455.1 PTS sugar transporter subunit IIA [Bombilactobacillus folatiphilus]